MIDTLFANARPLYIFDLDGTLANGDHRLPHITGAKKDWDSFFKLCGLDEPIGPMCTMLRSLYKGGADIWVWTGRSDMVRAETLEWFNRYGLDLHDIDNFRMRAYKDHTNDDVLKARWLDEMSPVDRKRLVAVFEDRKRVVDMYRTRGVTCLQVAQGDF